MHRLNSIPIKQYYKMVRVLQTFENREYLRKIGCKLPKTICPDVKTSSVSLLYKHVSAFDLGIVTEHLLCQDKIITFDMLNDIIDKVSGTRLSNDLIKRKPIVNYIECINTTRNLLHQEFNGKVYYQKELTRDGSCIIGHPDAMTNTQIFEIKTTRQLKKSWKSFLCQLFSYAALSPHIQTVYLVLPLQQYIWSYDLTQWKHKDGFWNLMKEFRSLTFEQQHLLSILTHKFPIGDHVLKEKTVEHTLLKLIYQEETHRPYQIMFSQSTKLSVDDTDLAKSSLLIQQFNIRLYIHSPYMLNLCIEPYTQDDYVVECMKKHLDIGKCLGSQGVVIHVGKQCKRDSNEAWNNMVINMRRCIEYATEDCPVLIETPAGQGSETLRDIETFMKFVEEINDPRMKICVDTCHVFASGQCPYDYLQAILSNDSWKKHLKLLHYNDSYGKCGSCVDRHAQLGTGLINHDILIRCAELCYLHNIDMLCE